MREAPDRGGQRRQLRPAGLGPILSAHPDFDDCGAAARRGHRHAWAHGTFAQAPRAAASAAQQRTLELE